MYEYFFRPCIDLYRRRDTLLSAIRDFMSAMSVRCGMIGLLFCTYVVSSSGAISIAWFLALPVVTRIVLVAMR